MNNNNEVSMIVVHRVTLYHTVLYSVIDCLTSVAVANGDLPDVAIATDIRVMVRCLGLIDWLFLFLSKLEVAKGRRKERCMLRHMYSVQSIGCCFMPFSRSAGRMSKFKPRRDGVQGLPGPRMTATASGSVQCGRTGVKAS